MLEPIEQQYFEAGYVSRSHGVNGEVLITSDINAPQLFDEIDLVHIQNTRGDLIPARIESARVQKKQSRLSFFVKFEHVTDRNEAEKLKGCTIYVNHNKVEPYLDDSEATANYTSFEVMDANNHPIGVVSAVIENPAHPIIQVDIEDGPQLLVPFVDEYIHSVDTDAKTLVCQNLDQLTDKL